MTTLEDRAEIVALTHAYCWALDTHQWRELHDVFTTDAVAELGDTCVGIEAIVTRVSEVLTRLRASQHMVSTHQIVVDGDRATSRCYLQAQHVRDVADGERQALVGGRYDDELVRTAAGWRIQRRVLSVIWTAGELSILAP